MFGGIYKMFRQSKHRQFLIKLYIVCILGRDEGYTIKYSPSSEEVPKDKAPKGEGLYLTVYPESSPNTDSI